MFTFAQNHNFFSLTAKTKQYYFYFVVTNLLIRHDRNISKTCKITTAQNTNLFTIHALKARIEYFLRPVLTWNDNAYFIVALSSTDWFQKKWKLYFILRKDMEVNFERYLKILFSKNAIINKSFKFTFWPNTHFIIWIKKIPILMCIITLYCISKNYTNNLL